MDQIHYCSLAVIPKVIPFYLLRPGAYVPDIAMPDVHPAAVPRTLDMRRGAVERPVALLVAEATLPPGGAVLVLMVSVVGAALTTIVPRELHLSFAGPGTLGSDPHCHLIERGALQCIVGSSTTAIAPTTRRSVELAGT